MRKGDSPHGETTDNLVVPERAGLFVEATQHYGPLVVREGDYLRADERPWSGYWFPLKDDILIAASPRNGGQPPLDKYDKYAMEALGKATTSVQEEIQKFLYNPMAENWEGRCGAWAIASVMEPEPVLPAEGRPVPGTDLTFYTRDSRHCLSSPTRRSTTAPFIASASPTRGIPPTITRTFIRISFIA